MDNQWGKIIFWQQNSEEEDQKFQEKSSKWKHFYRKICFTKQLFLWKSAQPGELVGRGVWGRQRDAWKEMLSLTHVNWTDTNPSPKFCSFWRFGVALCVHPGDWKEPKSCSSQAPWAGWIFNHCLNVTLSKSFWAFCLWVRSCPHTGRLGASRAALSRAWCYRWCVFCLTLAKPDW